MSEVGISEARLDRLVGLLQADLAKVAIDAPHSSEREPSYTRRCVTEPVSQFLMSLDIPGLVVAGELEGPVRPIYLLGRRFYPDISIAYGGDMLIAIEVKYLRNSGSIATAIGQAMVYRTFAYRRALVFMVNRSRNPWNSKVPSEIEQIRLGTGVPIVFRNSLRGALQPTEGAS